MQGSRIVLAGWLITAAWLACHLLSLLLPGTAAGSGFALGSMMIMLLFVIVHAQQAYGWQGLAAFVAITAATAFALEASSIATGFPFGYYTHHAPGPKPLGVPLHVVLGYVLLGWFGWSIGKTITRASSSIGHGAERFTTPIVAAFVLAGYDFPYDPIGSTVQGMWSYGAFGGFFGVPLSNYLGWLLTGWVFFQLFALVEHRFRPRAAASSGAFRLQPCLIWLGMALQYPFLLAAGPAGAVEASGRVFLVRDIYESALAASLFTMVFPALIAIIFLHSGLRMDGQPELDAGRGA